MTTLTLELPAELVACLEHAADETGRPLDALVADTLTARFAPRIASPDATLVDERIRLRPVSLGNWPIDTTFRREELYGDDAR